jgi:hypothetical protein
MATKTKATAELDLLPTDLSEVFAPEVDELESLDEEGEDGEYEDEDETEDEDEVDADAVSGKKSRKTRALRQYICTDSSYDWIQRIEASSIRAASKIILETPDLGLQAGSSLIIAEVKLDTKLRVTFGI